MMQALQEKMVHFRGLLESESDQKHCFFLLSKITGAHRSPRFTVLSFASFNLGVCGRQGSCIATSAGGAEKVT